MSARDDVPRTAVNQGPYGGTDYPFTAAGVLDGIVLDLYLSYYDPAQQYKLPFSLSVVGTVFTVTDSNAVIVASGNISTGGTSRVWGSRTVYEWISDPWVLRVVVRADLLEDGAGVLDVRTCEQSAKHVRSVRVGMLRMTGKIQIQTGYNISLSATPIAPVDGGRLTNQVNMDAVPGAGIGKLNGCDAAETVLRKINKVQPDCGGNFIVDFDNCFRAQLPLFMVGDQGEPRIGEFSAQDLTTEQAKHAIKIYSDCHPCCECDYYVRTYRGLKRMWDKWKEDATRAEAVRDTYNDNRKRWLESYQCRLDNPARLVASTDKTCKTAIGGSFCNFTTCCVHNIEIRFTFQRYKSALLVPWTSGSITEAFISGSNTDGEEKYAPSIVGSQVVRFFFDYADPQDMSIAKMKFCTTACASDESLQVVMTVHANSPPPNPHTGDPCTITTATPTSDIMSIWSALGVPATPTIRASLTKTVALDPSSPTFSCGC